MADYVPLFTGQPAFTSQASTTITGGQLLAVSGSGTVGPCGAASAAFVGVAAFDAASGDKVTVHTGGVQRLTASGSITAGAAVISGASGTVATIGAETVYSRVVGVALTTAADGAIVEVLMAR